jgi:hypothetical protein
MGNFLEFICIFIFFSFLYIIVLLLTRNLVSKGYNLLLARIVLAFSYAIEVAIVLIIKSIILSPETEIFSTSLIAGIVGFVISYGRGLDLLTTSFQLGNIKNAFKVTLEERGSLLLAVVGITLPIALVILILFLCKLFVFK